MLTRNHPKTVIYQITPQHRQAIRRFLSASWGTYHLYSQERVFDADTFPGYIAYQKGYIIGLITYMYQDEEQSGEIMTLNVVPQARRLGVASRLFSHVKTTLQTKKCQHILVTTTNENQPARQFYAKHHFVEKQVHIESIAHARAIGITTPPMGYNGMPIETEIEFELSLF